MKKSVICINGKVQPDGKAAKIRQFLDGSKT